MEVVMEVVLFVIFSDCKQYKDSYNFNASHINFVRGSVFLEIFFRHFIFLKHWSNTVKLSDWHQGNRILIQFALYSYTKFLVNYAKRVQLDFKSFSKNFYFTLSLMLWILLGKFHQTLQSFAVCLSFHIDSHSFILTFKVSCRGHWFILQPSTVFWHSKI